MICPTGSAFKTSISSLNLIASIKSWVIKSTLNCFSSICFISKVCSSFLSPISKAEKGSSKKSKEGFITSQVGIGTFVSTSNIELLRESKRRLVEKKMLDMIQTAKSLNISKEELNAMMDILYEEEN